MKDRDAKMSGVPSAASTVSSPRPDGSPKERGQADGVDRVDRMDRMDGMDGVDGVDGSPKRRGQADRSVGASAVSLPQPRRSVAWQVRKAWSRDKYLYLLFLPPLVYFLLFQYVPMYGLTLAFKDFDAGKGIFGSPWVGFKHFQEFFANAYSYKLIWNTVILRLTHLTFGFPMPIIFALALNELTGKRFKRFVQSSSYLPHFISLVVVAGMVVSFLASDGPVNTLVKALGGQPRQWLFEPQWFRPIYIISGIWQDAGWFSIIYVAALTGISLELYEAAAMDGANRFQRIRHISLPGMMPTVIIMFLLRVGQLLTIDFQKILLLYTGATYETADVLGTYIYRRGILGADFAFATAVGLFQALVGLVFIVAANSLVKRLSGTSLW